MVTGAGAMVNGIGAMVYGFGAMVTGIGSMDDGLAQWITGDWWMMLALPSWYCVCSRNCDIPLVPSAELISSPAFPYDCLCVL